MAPRTLTKPVLNALTAYVVCILQQRHDTRDLNVSSGLQPGSVCVCVCVDQWSDMATSPLRRDMASSVSHASLQDTEALLYIYI